MPLYRSLLTWFLVLNACLCLGQESDYLLWAKTSGFPEGATARQSDMDAQQNLYVIGTTFQSVPWHDDPGQDILLRYIFVNKYDKQGVLQWSKKFGGDREASMAGDIRIDKDNNIIVTGYLNDPEGLAFGQPSTGFFIAKLDTGGNLTWISPLSKTDIWTWGEAIQTSGNQSKVEIDDDNSIITYTNYNPTASPRPSHHGLYISRYSTDGALIDQFQITSNDNFDAPLIGGLTITPDGSFVVTGYFHVSLTMGAIVLGTPGTQSDLPVRLFVAKFSSAGLLQWVKSTPGGLSEGFDVDADDTGNIYLTGIAEGHSTLGGSIQINPGDPFSGFIAKLDPNGEILSSKPINVEPTSIRRMPNNDLYITGSLVGSLVFENYKIPREDEQAFVIKINADESIGGLMVSDGKPLGFTYKIGHNTTIDNAGNVYTIGNFYKRIVFGCDTLLSDTNEMFVIKHSHLPPVYALEIDGPVPACDGGTVKLSTEPIPDPVKYFWLFPSSIQPTNINANEMEFNPSSAADRAEINVRIKKGCESYESVRPYVVELKSRSSPGVVTGDQLFCNPGTTRFLTTRDNEATSYVWTLPEGIEPGGSALETVEPYIDVEVTSSFSQGSIKAVAINGCFQIEAGALEVRLLSKPHAVSFVNTPIEICFTSAPLQLAITPSPQADRYNWDISSNFDEEGQLTTTQTVINLNVKEGGPATITVTPQNDCYTGDLSVYSFVLSEHPVTPSIFASPCDRELSTDATENIAWFKNEMAFAKDISTLSVLEEGDYYITTSNGCGTSRSATLSLRPTSLETLVVPNVITPNQDNRNDYLVTAPQVEGLSVKVLNRWGNTVFSSSNYNYDWDGGDVAAGVYFIELTHQCSDKPIFGTLQVVR